ncbi:MAG TPA: hypothetical protein VG897_12535 [Terriglobales bacterium]|nr:hypothetical protein [Terriglobales bacterium]
MLFLKYMMLVVGVGMFLVAAVIVANDAWLAAQYRRKTASGAEALEPQPIRWRTTLALVCLAWAPLLIGMSLVVLPSSSSRMHDHSHAALVAAADGTSSGLRH